MIEIVEKPLDIGFNHEVVLSELELDRQFIDRVECALVRTVSITTAQETQGGERHRGRCFFFADLRRVVRFFSVGEIFVS